MIYIQERGHLASVCILTEVGKLGELAWWGDPGQLSVVEAELRLGARLVGQRLNARRKTGCLAEGDRGDGLSKNDQSYAPHVSPRTFDGSTEGSIASCGRAKDLN